MFGDFKLHISDLLNNIKEEGLYKEEWIITYKLNSLFWKMRTFSQNLKYYWPQLTLSLLKSGCQVVIEWRSQKGNTLQSWGPGPWRHRMTKVPNDDELVWRLLQNQFEWDHRRITVIRRLCHSTPPGPRDINILSRHKDSTPSNSNILNPYYQI